MTARSPLDLPAVAIGGPPHAGKSVLTYSLTQALRARDIDHYVVRAYPPDGEGDWFLAGAPAAVRPYRIKGAVSEAWLPRLCRDIRARHLPLIVDMGGLPTAEQEALLDACTHALLLTRDAASHQEWAARVARHGLALLADLTSDLHGTNALTDPGAPLRGVLAGLERPRGADRPGAMARSGPAAGPAFDALVDRLADLFGDAAVGLRRRHLEAAPVELAVDLRQLAHRLHVAPGAWAPADLPAVLDYLPTGQPLGLYGRGPNWLYAAVAAHARPAAFVLFDARRGWIAPPALRAASSGHSASPPAPWRLAIANVAGSHHRPGDVYRPAGVLWTLTLPERYLDPEDVQGAELPPWPAAGLILSGQLPHWLVTALARAHRGPWLALHQPQLAAAVVVAGRPGAYAPGDCLPVA